MNKFTSPIQNQIGGTFIPVRDIEKARNWYCKILGISETPEIMGGHLCPLPMKGAGLILDTMPGWGGKVPGGAPTYQTPAFMFATDDIEASYQFMEDNGVELVTDIEHGHWFAFRDPDGNLLMVCK